MNVSSLAFKSLITALAVALPLSVNAVEEQGALPLDELRTFADVYNQIRRGYVEEIDDSTLLEYAIQGMLMGLDPHSVYLTEDAFQNLQDTTSGEFTGLGLEVGMEDGYVKVVSPIDGSPAAAAGLQSGDIILKLDQAPVKGMSLNDAIEIMRGPKGTKIELTIGRPGESQPFDVTVIRDVIKVASVRQRWLEPGYGYIRIAQFQNATGEDVGKSLAKLMDEQELKGLVLDLRNNPGGILRASVDVAGLFMDGGTVVYTEGRLANSDILIPDDFFASVPACQHTGQNEQQIGKAIQVSSAGPVYRFEPGKAQEFALGTSTHRARDMAVGRGLAAAWQDELLERWQVGIEAVEGFLQVHHPRVADHLGARHGQLAAEVEKAVLYRLERSVDRFRQCLGAQQSDKRIQFVHAADRVDASVVLCQT